MRWMLVLAVSLGSLSLASAQAQAQSAEDTAQNDCSRARALGKQCVLTIGAEEVTGGVLKPEGEVLSPRTFVSAGSLIRLRHDFIPEILKSAEQQP
jgi:hypothetical protein